MKSKNLIEHLYSLSLERAEEIFGTSFASDDELRKADALLEKYEELLPDDKKVDFSNDCCDYAYYYEKNAFVTGFMCGVRLMSEAFTDK